MKHGKRIVVTVEGGTIRGVCCNFPLDAEVVVIDYDIDGADPDRLKSIPQLDADNEDGYVLRHGKIGRLVEVIDNFLQENP